MHGLYSLAVIFNAQMLKTRYFGIQYYVMFCTGSFLYPTGIRYEVKFGQAKLSRARAKLNFLPA